MITSNERSGVLRFGKLPKVIADGEYIFTLQVDYGVECRAASETISVRRARIRCAQPRRPIPYTPHRPHAARRPRPTAALR
eukprot:3360199-Prymnesium_polylepis.1